MRRALALVLFVGIAQASPSLLHSQSTDGVFKLNRDRIKAPEKLAPLLAAVRASQGAIEISVHGDARGSTKYTTLLSQKRADAIRDYLVSKGVVRSRITTIGRGPSQPLKTHAASRRIELRGRATTAASKPPASVRPLRYHLNRIGDFADPMPLVEKKGGQWVRTYVIAVPAKLRAEFVVTFRGPDAKKATVELGRDGRFKRIGTPGERSWKAPVSLAAGRQVIRLTSPRREVRFWLTAKGAVNAPPPGKGNELCPVLDHIAVLAADDFPAQRAKRRSQKGLAAIGPIPLRVGDYEFRWNHGAARLQVLETADGAEAEAKLTRIANLVGQCLGQRVRSRQFDWTGYTEFLGQRREVGSMGLARRDLTVRGVHFTARHSDYEIHIEEQRDARDKKNRVFIAARRHDLAGATAEEWRRYKANRDAE